ncbi:MAG: hypothetical protein IJD77_02180 [Clostridia bacterium]|nr:hypothetical protein [Clostridia bacterium]
MANRLILYGYEKLNNGFFIETDFLKNKYYYFEKQEDFLFERQWGTLAPHWTASYIHYKNLKYRGIVNRYDYWDFYIYRKDGKCIVFEKKKNKIYHYGINDPRADVNDNYVNLSNDDIIESDRNNADAIRKKTRVSKLVEEMLKKYTSLYEQIKDKDCFFKELEEYYFNLMDGTESEEDIEEYLIEAERQFQNFINSEKFCSELNVEKILNEFSYAKKYLNQIDLLDVLEYIKELFKGRIGDFTLEDVLEELKREIDYRIEGINFKKKIETYNIEYILKKYDKKIAQIVNKKDFMENLQKAVEEAKEFPTTEELFLDEIQCFINHYLEKEHQKLQRESFIAKYGSEEVVIELTEEKSLLFDNLVGEEIPKENLKEYELYQELKQVQNAEMYCKDGKTLKPSFRAIPTFISNFQKIIKTATEYNLIQWNGEEYEFVSIDQLQAFGKKLK